MLEGRRKTKVGRKPPGFPSTQSQNVFKNDKSPPEELELFLLHFLQTGRTAFRLYQKFKGFFHDFHLQMIHFLVHHSSVQTNGGIVEGMKLNLSGTPHSNSFMT